MFCRNSKRWKGGSKKKMEQNRDFCHMYAYPSYISIFIYYILLWWGIDTIVWYEQVGIQMKVWWKLLFSLDPIDGRYIRIFALVSVSLLCMMLHSTLMLLFYALIMCHTSGNEKKNIQCWKEEGVNFYSIYTAWRWE